MNRRLVIAALAALAWFFLVCAFVGAVTIGKSAGLWAAGAPR